MAAPAQTIQNQTDYFVTELTRRKQVYDAVVEEYWKTKLDKTEADYGEVSRQSIGAFASVMARGGKRIRAALAETGYRMFGGTDENVIKNMGLALEMIHAYILIIDDICDRSDLRRGGPTAHRILEEWHRQSNLHGNPAHFGNSMATLAAMTGMHEAMLVVGQLPVSDQLRMQALENLNKFIVVTCHGQFNDIMNEAATTRDEQQIEDVLVWKTAYYTFANPLQFGAILAGAPQEKLDALMSYSLAAGRAFQISDDILGLYGDAANTGKSPADDIKEGKRTILTVKALELAPPADGEFLESKLGDANLTDDEFEQCKRIIKDSGALAFAQNELQRSCQEAIRQVHTSALPEGDGTRFLIGLAHYLKGRKS